MIQIDHFLAISSIVGSQDSVALETSKKQIIVHEKGALRSFGHHYAILSRPEEGMSGIWLDLLKKLSTRLFCSVEVV